VSSPGLAFNPPPGWPAPPPGWTPPDGWQPEASWPPAPADWVFWKLPESQPLPFPPTVIAPAPTRQPPSSPGPPANPDARASASETYAAAAEARYRRRLSAAAKAGEEPGQPVSAPSALTTDSRAELAACRAQIAAAERSIHELKTELERVRAGGRLPEHGAPGDDMVDLDDAHVLQDVGIYRYRHPLEHAPAYKARLDGLQERIKTLVRDRDAVSSSDMFTFDNSLAKGRKLTADLGKLMLRAYNAEADNAIRSLRAGNLQTATRRLVATKTAVARLGAIMELRITDEFHELRLEELELTSDYLMKLQEEREAAREERERLREERRASQELEEERDRLAKERAHYANALAALVSSGAGDTATLQSKLDELDESIAHNDYRLANIRAGYVYVISNSGAFGPGVVKIGLTRRLEPMERVRELGGASVPFPFDVHALFFSGDAVTLETQLHRAFSGRRVNRVNERREFFFATPAEVREALSSRVGSLLEYADEPEALQFLQSKKYWPATAPTVGPPN